jgi:phenylacetate-CoA ligase
VLDDGAVHGVDWKRWDTRIVCAAEAFSEHFRDYLMQKIGVKDPYRSVMNVYGSAELGTMATETPISILLRRLALKNDTFYRKLFRDASRLPTLGQFIPEFVSFEENEDGRIYATYGTVLPLIRYDIGDHGGVLTFADIVRIARESGIDLVAEIKRADIAATVHQLPFVYVYERADFSAKLYGAIIYPEHVKIGLQKTELEREITGRFTMTTEHDPKHNEYLEINIEMRASREGSDELKKQITSSIVDILARNSAEYQHNLTAMKEKMTPRILFWPYEHPQYFRPGIKQKWVIRPKE